MALLFLPYEKCGGGGLVAKSCLTLVTPWTVARQTPPSIRFSRQEYWSGLPCPPPGDLPEQGWSTRLLGLLHWQESTLLLLPPVVPEALSNI